MSPNPYNVVIHTVLLLSCFDLVCIIAKEEYNKPDFCLREREN